jgi:choline dehydrogenase-like flavoprotein
MLIDARTIDDGAELEFDLAIIGSGPAGIAIADQLRNVGGLSIALIESGGFDPELRTQRLYRGENVGDPYYGLDTCRYRLFGGSSNRWGGWCRPFDPADFEPREWIPGSGWPIRSEDLEPYYTDTARLLELSTPDFSMARWSDRVPAPLRTAGSDFEHVIYQFSPETNFAEQYGPLILAASNITTLIHANVTRIGLDTSGERVDSLLIRTLSGRSHTIKARVVVLAAGGIENARLLLASRDQRRTGIGNENDLVGRYFMEHIHVGAGHIAANGHPIPTGFYQQSAVDDTVIRGAMTPSADALRRTQLPSCSIALETWSHSVHGAPFLGWSPVVTTGPVIAYRRLHRKHPGLADSIRGRAQRMWRSGHMARNARAEIHARTRHIANRLKGLHVVALYFRAEQVPDRDSRVLLDARCDELGMPLARLDWRVGESDRASIIHWLQTLDAGLQQTGTGTVVMPQEGWEKGVIGGPHHMGTTRMSADPHTGVVDSDCRVHSVQNLYVAGSSVFTTGGYVNPTFALVALALRLADHLKRDLTSG